MKRFLLTALAALFVVSIGVSSLAATSMAKKTSPTMMEQSKALDMAARHATMMKQHASMKKMDMAAVKKDAMAMGKYMDMARMHRMMMSGMKDPKAMMHYKAMTKSEDAAMMHQRDMMKQMGMKQPNATIIRKHASMAEMEAMKARSECNMMMKQMDGMKPMGKTMPKKAY
jgi:hypothetical protein